MAGTQGDENKTERIVPTQREKPVMEKAIKIYPFSIERLSEDNARYWFHAVEKQMKIQFCWQAIEFFGRVGGKEYSAALHDDKDWFKLDLKADAIIEHGLSPSTVLEVRDLPNVGQKWEYLKKTFLKSSNTRKAMKLMKMANWTWNSSVMNEKEGFREISQICEEFNDMNGGDMVTTKELLVLWYLRGLGDKYATLRDTVLSSNDALDKDYVMSRVEDVMQMRNESTEKASRGKQGSNQKGLKCFICQTKGHKAKDCPDRKNSGNSKDQGNDDTNGHKQTGQSRKSTKQRGRIAGEDTSDDNGVNELDEFGGYAHEELSEKATYASEKANLAMCDPSKWCFDSGATSMSTGCRDIFEFLDTSCFGTLTIANGVQMPIKGRGVVRFMLKESPVRLGNVIYVPGLAENLLSLEALHMAGYKSVGSRQGYAIIKNGSMLARGKRIGRSTYLHSVANQDALLIKPAQRRHMQIAKRADDGGEDVIERKRELIHRRLGHPGKKRFNNCLQGLDMEELALGKHDALLDDKCEVCVKSKQVKNQSHIPVPRARKPLQRVYMDFWGPNRDSIGDERYYLSLIDDCTRYSWVFIKADRKSESVVYTLESWLRQVERQSGKMLMIIRTDNAREFIALRPWAESKGIELEFIETDTPPQNGVAERFNRSVLEIARSLLMDSRISKKYWKYAIVTANYLRNRTTLVKDSADDDSGGKDRTPYELWNGYPPDLTHLRTWGCRVLYHHRADDKLDSRVMEATFLVYGKSDKQYLVLPRGASELKLVTNPTFRERENGYLCEPVPTATPVQQDMPVNPPYSEAVRPSTGGVLNGKDRPADKPVEKSAIDPMNVDKEADDTDRNRRPSADKDEGNNQWSPAVDKGKKDRPLQASIDGIGNEANKEVDSGNQPEVRPVVEEERNKDPPAPAKEREVDAVNGRTANPIDMDTAGIEPRYPTRTRHPSRQMMESHQTEQTYGRKRKAEGEESDRPAQRMRAQLARLAVATELLVEDREYEVNEKAREAREKAGIRIPRSYTEAINDPIYGAKWKEAIHRELSALISFRTWTIKPRKEVGDMTISTTRWVFDVKLGADGRIERFKARLVARGNEQSDDDFDETFAPVFRLDSLRILIAIAIMCGMSAHVLDASNAFAGSDLDKPNCMEIPEGLQDFDPDTGIEDMVLELRKSIYGLRQSAYLWHRKISQFLMKIGFKPATADPSVFINGRGLIIALYVDDIIIFGKDPAEIDAVKKKLKDFHPMTDGGLVKKLLGIRFTWGDKSVRLDQESYGRQILDEFGMADCKPTNTPISPSVKLDTEDSPLLGRGEHKLFRRLIGRLMFMVIATRPDIAFAVNQLSQYLAGPRRIHLGAAKHVLRYIKGTIGYGLMFGSKGSKDNGLVAYADSAYANSAKSRSTTGFVFMINGAPIAWSSRKQSITAQSTTEAEYMAVSEAAKQAIWVRHFLHAIGKGSIYHDAPTTIYEDNRGAINIADNPINHPKTKHIAVRYHAIRDHINNGEVRLEHLATDSMLADGLTKATHHVKHGEFIEGLGIGINQSG